MKNEWLFAKTYWSLFRKKQLQQQFLSNYIKGELSHSFDQFSPSLQFKINYYASWGVVAISEVFATIFNKPLSEKERLQATEMSLLFALADELIDEDDLNLKSISELTTKNTSHSIRYIEAQRLLVKFQDETSIWPTLQEAIKAQIASQAQKKTSDIDQIRSLTFEKGSWTMLLYRQLIEEKLSVQETQTVKLLGYCLQLADDLLDAFDDTAENISTTANLIDLQKVVSHYRTQVNLAKNSFFTTYGRSKNTVKAFRTFQILFAISEMAVDQFTKNGIVSFHQTDFSWLNRSHFIVDMEKRTTVLRSLAYCGKQ
ncbi:hypothetical protein GYB57_05250 [bacterium]|nr:hypothetical protein [bacterium]